MRRLNRLAVLLRGSARGLAALAALAGLGWGFALFHPGLGLIVPSAFVLGCLTWSHTRGGR